jgi:hypothetical protein
MVAPGAKEGLGSGVPDFGVRVIFWPYALAMQMSDLNILKGLSTRRGAS